ncbi:MAG TPA: gliding motility-associated C-terminal domain-containing protein, partial [Flavobacteriales bacterium]|nr:gliding motility-associated C-terminal domain-containing protein [Flavobacteriales bacterium]
PLSGWPFSAFIEGYTAEASGSEVVFTPSVLCANVCDFDAKIFCRYGVPPYTFTHPWSTDTITGGTASGCSPGTTFKTLHLVVPACPDYCDTITQLDVPPPVVTDACGTVVVGYNSSYNLNIKPVAQVTFDQTALSMCSGAVFSANLTSCLPGSTINWTSSDGQSGSTTTLGDTIFNTGNASSTVEYHATVVTNGCTGIPDSMTVTTFPYVVDTFSVTTEPFLVNTPITFNNLTQLNGNSLVGYVWTFGDSTGSILDDEIHQYSDTGFVTICHYTTTSLGCDDSSCQTILILDMELQYPNIITPNGDGINDALYFKALEFYPDNKLEVFNRWGNLLYEKAGYTNDWNAPDLTDGVYYYVLNIKDKEPYKSILHIVRNN